MCAPFPLLVGSSSDCSTNSVCHNTGVGGGGSTLCQDGEDGSGSSPCQDSTFCQDGEDDGRASGSYTGDCCEISAHCGGRSSGISLADCHSAGMDVVGGRVGIS